MDTVSDLLTRIRNAIMAQKVYVDVKCSRFNREILSALQQLNFIKNFVESRSNKYELRVYLSYRQDRTNMIRGIKRESKPGCRRYVKRDEIPYIKNRYGYSILSTSQGVLNSKEARQKNVGGELLCSVW